MGKTQSEFEYESNKDVEFKVLVTAVKLPTGAIEIITNTQEIKSKIDYIRNAYDYDLRLKNNPHVQIVNFMLV